MIIKFANYPKVGVAVSVWEDRNKKQTALDKSKKSGGKLKGR